MNPSLPITFESFMRQALYDPKRGYYARRITGVGRRGDFTTAPMLSDAPARAIAGWAAKALRETGCRDLIEIGPGEGRLSSGVLRHLPWTRRWRTRLHLVETSEPLAKIQRKALGARVIWHREMAHALAACEGRAVIFSNELVDAFPVRRFEKTQEGWREIAVRFDEHRKAHESLLPRGELPDSSAFQDSHPLGQRVEVHQSYQRYLESWMPQWKAGRMLTIDYGSTAERIYQRRPHGTVRAYLLQQRLEGAAIYDNPGRQDLTADVNFTDLIHWSSPWVSEQHVMTFRELLEKSSVKNCTGLTHPEGAGGAFLVLDQKK